MTRRARLIGLFMALVAGIGGGIGVVLALRSAPWPKGMVAEASSQATDQLAGLAIDGRLRGRLPYAWRPSGRGPGRLTLRFPMPLPLAGARIVGARGDAVRVIAPRPTASDGEVISFSGAAVDELVVESNGAEIAEIEPIVTGAPVVISADPEWAVELLRAYGVPTLAAIAPGPGLAAALTRCEAIIVADTPLPEAAVAELRRAAERGATVVELGPRAGVCAPAAPPETGPPKVRHLVGGIRWPLPLSAPPDGEPVEVRLATTDGEPVLVERPLGSGRCFRWLGDLLATMAELRFGSDTSARSFVDRFAGLSRGDHDVPSADLLFGYVLAALGPATGPELLVSPLPGGAPSVLVFTADQDYVPDLIVQAQVAEMPRGSITVLLTHAQIGGAPDIRFPESPSGLSTPETIRGLIEDGQDVGIHPSFGDSDGGETVKRHAAALAAVTGVDPRIVRMHHLAWSPDLPRALAAAHLMMDLDFVSLAHLPDGDLGFMAGGGVPLRFLDTDGAVLPILQQPTMLDDHVLLPARFGYRPLDVAALIARSRTILDIAARHAVPLAVNHHPHWFVQTDGRWQRALVEDAAARGIPVWSAGRWLDFTLARRQVMAARVADGIRAFVPVEDVTLLVSGADPAYADGRALAPRGERQVGWRRFQVFVPPRGTISIPGHR